MKKVYWIILFSFILAINIVGVLLGNGMLQYVSKPLLMIILAGYFFSQTNKIVSVLKKWIFLSLFFSWTGDVVLMFQENNSLFFLIGLSAFLVAHIFYIFLFHNIRIIENIKSNLWLLVLVVLYYAVLITLLSPHLGDMKLPVRIYGIVISFMFMLAMHMLYIKNKIAGQWMMIGALMFVLSDSMLAINKFYQSFQGAGIVIMGTYGLAQLFIIEGASRYIISKQEK